MVSVLKGGRKKPLGNKIPSDFLPVFDITRKIIFSSSNTQNR